MPRWRIAAGVLAPLAATEVVVLLHGSVIPGSIMLLAAIAFASLFGGRVAGIAALILAGALYSLVVLPIRGTVDPFTREALEFTAAFVLAGAALVAVLTRLRSASERAEERAAELAERIDLMGPVLDAAPVGFALFDTDLRYRYVNGRLAEINNIPAADHLGKRVVDLFPPELVEPIEASVREVLRTGRPHAAELTRMTVDGEPRHFLLGRHPVLDDAGRVVGVVAAVLDVTERERVTHLEAEAGNLRATAELAHKLEEAQRLAGFGSWEHDIATGTTTFSRQFRAMFGVPADHEGSLAAAGGRIHPDDLARVVAARDALRADGTPLRCEYRFIRPDGRVMHVLSTGEMVLDESGHPVRMWGTVQDVTDQRAAERAAQEAALHAEQARAELEIEHQALQMFQRAMLPAEMPDVLDVDLSAVYLPMAERIDIGGDWYDAFVLPDGRLALAVGDVTGHDLRAATVMGQVRNAVRAYATEYPDPGTVLARVNTLLARLPDLDLVTMLFGVYDPASHELVWSNAGHPAPLVRRGRTVTALTEPGGLLLGVIPDGDPYPERRLRLGPGDTVLWYTDGIVDHRSIDPVDALRSLSRVFAGAPGNAGALLEVVSSTMLADGEREDDVCLLAMRRTGEPVNATPASPAGMVTAAPDEPAGAGATAVEGAVADAGKGPYALVRGTVVGRWPAGHRPAGHPATARSRTN
jgi:sigma-B regulation protein RsbU (phosphoserine phosphatase)